MILPENEESIEIKIGIFPQEKKIGQKKILRGNKRDMNESVDNKSVLIFGRFFYLYICVVLLNIRFLDMVASCYMFSVLCCVLLVRKGREVPCRTQILEGRACMPYR